MWLVFEHTDPGPFVIRLPQRLDYEIGAIWPGVPFQVPDDVGQHLLGPRGVPQVKRVYPPDEPERKIIFLS